MSKACIKLAPALTSFPQSCLTWSLPSSGSAGGRSGPSEASRAGPWAWRGTRPCAQRSSQSQTPWKVQLMLIECRRLVLSINKKAMDSSNFFFNIHHLICAIILLTASLKWTNFYKRRFQQLLPRLRLNLSRLNTSCIELRLSWSKKYQSSTGIRTQTLSWLHSTKLQKIWPFISWLLQNHLPSIALNPNRESMINPLIEIDFFVMEGKKYRSKLFDLEEKFRK